MEAEKEDAENITLFLSLFLETLQKVSKNPNLKYQPRGFLVDSAGANFHGIHAVFGRQGVLNTATCQWHFKQCASQHLPTVPEEYQMSFKKHIKDLCMAPTEEEYSRIMIALRFICGEGNLLTWLEWWNAQKYHLIPAFQGFNIPGVNVAEIGQSALRNDCPMMLIDTTYLDAASMFIQNKQYKAFKNNTTNGCGHGPNQRKTAENSRRAQERRGEIYAENLLGHCQVQEINEEQEDEE